MVSNRSCLEMVFYVGRNSAPTDDQGPAIGSWSVVWAVGITARRAQGAADADKVVRTRLGGRDRSPISRIPNRVSPLPGVLPLDSGSCPQTCGPSPSAMSKIAPGDFVGAFVHPAHQGPPTGPPIGIS